MPAYAADISATLLPTEAMVERMLRAAKLGPADVLVDVGSGDGRTAFAAARRFGARALGVDGDATLVALNTQRAQAMGLSARVRFMPGAPPDAELAKASVVVLSTPGDAQRLAPKLLALKPGTRVLAVQPGMGEWAPDEVLTVDERSAYLWIVPALANGVWQLRLHGPGPRRDDRLRLNQRFQAVSGELLAGGDALPLSDVTLRGDLITFAVSDRRGNLRRFFGHIRGDIISGRSQAPGGATRAWEARRVAPH
jgi:SAM-dependent methyltransferase